MPECGSQVPICDVPIRFDTYKGCSFGCKYCFVRRKVDISKIEKGEGAAALLNFIEGKRSLETNWCDWDIPLHWGGVSDPFQPAEKIIKNSLECLKVLQRTQYPFLVSTKSTLYAESPYIELLQASNGILQVSAVCSKYDVLEKGAPTWKERIEAIRKTAPKLKRVNIRIQPYMTEVKEDVLEALKVYADIGVYGVTVEAMKFVKKKEGLEKKGADFVYPVEKLRLHFEELKDKAHSLGLKFYSGENRLRMLGDSLCCCGIDGLEGFRGNTANLNHYLYDKDNYIFTEQMHKNKTGGFAKCLSQKTATSNVLKNMSFKEIMESLTRDKGKISELIMK